MAKCEKVVRIFGNKVELGQVERRRPSEEVLEMNRRRGFTLIELLTVIAIIALLAAIIFPVYARAKLQALKSSDMVAMNSISTALQLYRVDQGGYPPALLGYASYYADNTVVPADKLNFFLKKRLDTVNTLTSSRVPNAESDRKLLVEAVWPNADPIAAGADPQLDLNGDGRLTSDDDPAGSRQKFTGNQFVTVNPNDLNTAHQKFYRVSSYDVNEVAVPGGGKRFELRYCLFWSKFGLEGGNAMDDPRQLGYSDPDDNTIVTWNSYFREIAQDGTPQRQKADIMLLLSGSARYVDSVEINNRSFRIRR
ncbi:MAG: type II secretion system protein [Armatimonadetes bacterium]|nr:type II secretion system protein [Armatimonadota bacterium]